MALPNDLRKTEYLQRPPALESCNAAVQALCISLPSRRSQIFRAPSCPKTPQAPKKALKHSDVMQNMQK